MIKNIPNYRKTVIAAIPTLTYLDDRPVFKEDRRNAEAFSRGGLEAEREERAKIKAEEKERHDRNHNAFKEMMKKAREEKKRVEQEARIARGEPEPAEEPKPSPEEVLENKLEQIEKETNKENNTALVNNKEERAGATVEEVVEEVKKIQ